MRKNQSSPPDGAPTGAAGEPGLLALVPQGPVGDRMRGWICGAESDPQAAGIPLNDWRPVWDLEIRPHAAAGVFQVRRRSPDILQRTGVL
ncbi:MAG: hypothetical protein AAGF79_06450 [Pseudomonadota bacterium]